MSAPVVTQADRDAAQALCASGWTHAIEAFVRHRAAAEAASAATVAELEALVADAYYVLTYVQVLAGDDVTRAACKDVCDQIDAHHARAKATEQVQP